MFKNSFAWMTAAAGLAPAVNRFLLLVVCLGISQALAMSLPSVLPMDIIEDVREANGFKRRGAR